MAKTFSTSAFAQHISAHSQAPILTIEIDPMASSLRISCELACLPQETRQLLHHEGTAFLTLGSREEGLSLLEGLRSGVPRGSILELQACLFHRGEQIGRFSSSEMHKTERQLEYA